jgi:hypothetical protein
MRPRLCYSSLCETLCLRWRMALECRLWRVWGLYQDQGWWGVLRLGMCLFGYAAMKVDLLTCSLQLDNIEFLISRVIWMTVCGSRSCALPSCSPAARFALIFIYDVVQSQLCCISYQICSMKTSALAVFTGNSCFQIRESVQFFARLTAFGCTSQSQGFLSYTRTAVHAASPGSPDTTRHPQEQQGASPG